MDKFWPFKDPIFFLYKFQQVLNIVFFAIWPRIKPTLQRNQEQDYDKKLLADQKF